MGEARPHRPVLLVLAAFSRHAALLEWARARAEQAWGALALESEAIVFGETDYYARTMGTPLLKKLFALQQLVDPALLPDYKQITNRWEEECRALGEFAEPRPLNLDPGYLTEAKLVLATTKDRDHRIYLRDGIFAEVTLFWHAGRWQGSRWTYPDYQRDDYHQFFTQCRNYLRLRYRHGGAGA